MLDSLCRGVSKLLISFALGGCLVPSDRVFRERALQNETESGFISQEFFQVLVDVPLLEEEQPGRLRREDCRKRALKERETLAMPFLVEAAQNKHRFFPGIEEFLRTTVGGERGARGVTPQSAVSLNPNPPRALEGQNPANQGQGTNPLGALNANPNAVQPTQAEEDPQEKARQKNLAERNRLYTAAFGWFFQDLHFYKEDFTKKGRCVFVFRNIQKNLYKKVESVALPSQFYSDETERTR